MPADGPSTPGLDPELDFLGPLFNALKALRTMGVQPPNTKVRPLDNVYLTRGLLPDDDPDSFVARLARNPRPVRSEVISSDASDEFPAETAHAPWCKYAMAHGFLDASAVILHLSSIKQDFQSRSACRLACQRLPALTREIGAFPSQGRYVNGVEIVVMPQSLL